MSEKPKKSLTVLGKVVVAAAVVAAFVLGYALHRAAGPAGADTAREDTRDAPDEKTAEVWTCAMHPQIRLPGPGQCPICAMDLIPATQEAEEVSGMRIFTTTDAARALMDIRTSPVVRREVAVELRMVGKVDYDETRFGYITAWVPGRLDKLHVDFTGVRVEKGQPMVYLYSPLLLATQEELLQAIRADEALKKSDVAILKETSAKTIVSVREKLRLLGLSPEQIREIEERGESADHVTVEAPMGGTVIHKNAQEGMYVKTGARIYTVADLSRVWVKMDAYESDLERLEVGQEVTFTSEAFPGEEFTGRVAFIDPFLNPKTRSVKVRVNVPNDEGKLKPEMFVRALVRSRAGREGSPPLVIPASAPLLTGTRAIVYVEVPGATKPTYQGREVVLGPRAGEYYVVRHGLREGEMVVTNGNFKIDSALQMQAKPSMMSPEGGGATGGHAHHAAAGVEAGPAGAEGRRAMAVPAAFAGQLRKVESAYTAVREAIEKGDLAKVRQAFAAFDEALDAVDAGLVWDHAHVVWMELAMLLGNDAFEGREAGDLSQARKTFAGLETHVRRLGENFPLHEARHAETVRAAPAEFQQQLAGVWREYLGVHKALAGDDFPSAAAAARQMQAALKGVDMALVEGAAHIDWTKHLAALEGALGSLARREDIAAMRAKFEALSEALAASITTFRIGSAGPVYRLKCPMAFGGKGAVWLQADTAVANPYFGAAMPKCGEVLETLVGETKPHATEHVHE